MITKNPIAQQSKLIEGMAEHWPMIRVLKGGTSAIRKEAETYLPKWPAESEKNYRIRLGVATLHPAFKRTSRILASKPFSKTLKLNDDVPKRLVELSKDIDLQGRNHHAFFSVVFQEALDYGISGVLVESPIRPEGVLSLQDEQDAGIRPYLTQYHPWNILGWRTVENKLVQLRLKESVTLPEGEYGEKIEERIRVLTPGAWRLFKKSEEKEGEWVLIQEGITSLDEIPFVMFYGLRVDKMIGDAPLLDLAFQNIEHYQSSSDQQNILHIARVPILFGKGFNENEKLVVGGSQAVKSTSVDASLQFVEHTGAAIGSGRQSILDLEERMRNTGAEMLMIRPGNATATEIISDNDGNKCDLQRSAEACEDSIDQCLQFMADFIGEPEGGTCQLFKDFGASSLSDASAQLLLTANQAGKLSDETLLNEWKRRDLLDPDIVVEDEILRIRDQGPPLGNIGTGAATGNE